METQTNPEEFKEELDRRLSNTWENIFKIWRNKKFQIFLDACRVLTLLLLIFIVYTLISEIEIIKLLASDPCLICMNKTGATCWMP